MIETKSVEARLLEEIQNDLPRRSQPFAEIGERCGISEGAVIETLERLTQDGVVREISAILDARKLGFFSSLVAVSTPPDTEGAVAARINAHPRVSHNYHRDHTYNLWFTLAAGSEDALAAEAAQMISPFPGTSFEIMPAVKTYKLRVSLKLTENGRHAAGESPAPAAEPTVHHLEKAPDLTDELRPLLARLESPFPLTARPWREIGFYAGMSEDRVLQLTGELKNRGVIRRVAGVLRHRKVGYTANGMSCFSVESSAMDSAGMAAAARPEVSHCYWRRTPENWEYPLFAMVHAKSEKECRDLADSIASEIGCRDHLVLFSTIEYKKERVKYFGGSR